MLSLALFLNGVASVALSSIGTYDPTLAKQMVMYSGASYCCGDLGKGVENWDCQVCKKLPHLDTTVFYDSKTNVNGFVGYDSAANTVIVAFAGTDPLSVKNWIDDIDTIKEKYTGCDNGCEVHAGFYNAYQTVTNSVRAAVTKYVSAASNPKIFCTGHSFGAALATYASLDIQNNLRLTLSGTYTFGQPRVGDANFHSWVGRTLKSPFWRITHQRDPVPHLPLEAMGFSHISTEVFYNEPSTSYKVCNGSGEDNSCSDQFLADVNLIDHLDYLTFDFTENYLACKL